MDTTMTPTDAPDCIQSSPPPPPKSPLSSPFSRGGGGMPASAGCRSAADVTTTTTTTSSVQRAIKDLLRSLLHKRVVGLVNRTVSSDSTPYKQSTIAGTVNLEWHVRPSSLTYSPTVLLQNIPFFIQTIIRQNLICYYKVYSFNEHPILCD